MGLAIEGDGGAVYVAGGGQVTKFEDEDLNGSPDTDTTIVEGFLSFVYDSHSNNGIALGPNGKLYITLGRTSDHGPEQHPLVGSILEVDTDGLNTRVYASGMRNPYDLAFASDGRL